jgi:peptidoglycan/xylan/chitin deacetylase (PgdA/CDA1 family)
MASVETNLLRNGLKLLQSSGLANAFRNQLQGIGSIFCLHQVLPGGGQELGFTPNRKLEISPEFLSDLIKLVHRRGFETVALGTLVERLTSGQVGKKPMAVFTLDDGYKDNLVHAKPVFDAHACPYTIFVAPGIADGTCNLWWRTLEQIVARTERIKVSSGEQNFDLVCRSVAEKNKSFNKLFDHFEALDQHEQRRQIDSLATAHSVDPKAYCRDEAMDWDELRQIAKSPLCTIGAHTINHFRVKSLSAEEAFAEMTLSKTRIETELERKVEFFAYPYGDKPAAGPRDFDLAQKAGFVASVTTRKGVVWPDDVVHLQSLPRIMVSGQYQELDMIDALISGLPTALLNKISPIHKG